MKDKVEEILENVQKEGRSWLLENEAEEIFEIYGIQVPGREVATSEKEAARIASTLGYPVALKILSPQVLHKSDVGGVKLGIQNEEELKKAYKEMVEKVGEKIPSFELRGILIQKMAPPGGKEVIIGGIKDPTFGPVVMFGLGGIWVEVFKDVTFRVAPVEEKEARRMIEEIKGKDILFGVRGEESGDIEALVSAISKISHLIADFPQIKEIDANPVFLYSKNLLCVDARIVLGE
ncbi:acetate--CoA ligase family protein [Candidatus Calescamantes bacterium]|nr:acetate--CoA ligase family protein [Candidatus Calescamantes bacterium]